MIVQQLGILLSALILTTLLFASAAYSQSADKVFTNGKVYTVNEKQPWAEAVAVKGDKIVYVGDAEGAKTFAGEGAEVIDLAGKMLLPGFVSAHDHLIASGWTKRGVSVFGIKNKMEALAKIKAYADENPDLELILGFGFNQVEFGGWPTKHDLDKVLPDRPVFILDYTIHDVWMNSKAFEVGGVAPDEPDQVPGLMFWQRDYKGNQTGIGIEFQWAPAFLKAGAWKPAEEIPGIQKNFYDYAVKTGLTTIHVPAIAAPGITNQALAAQEMEIAMAYLHQLEKKGELTTRTSVANAFKDPAGNPAEVAEHTAKLREKYNSDMLSVWGVKIHPEGNWNSKTSWMLKDFSDEPGNRGGAAIRGDKIMAMHMEMNKRGLPVGTHVDGSQTVRNTVEAILASNEAGYGIENNILHHYFWVAEAEHQSVIDNKIYVNATPNFHTDYEGQDKLSLFHLGMARVESQFSRYLDLLAIGHNVSISADVPSSPLEQVGPLFQIEAAMTARNPADDKSMPFPKRMKPASFEEALKAVTIYPAVQIGMSAKIGSVEVGKLADLVVLDTDITQVPVEKLSDVKVLATMMGGKFTHKNGL